MAYTIGRQAILVTGLGVLLGVAAVAAAQPADAPKAGMMGGGMMGGGGMSGGSWDTSSYLESIKAELGISADQAPAWKDYAGTVSGVSEKMQGLHRTMFDAMGTASWSERREMMNRMFDARTQAFTTVHEAAGTLMSALTPAQKEKAQGILPGLSNGPGMMGHHGGMMNGHGQGMMNGHGQGMMDGHGQGMMDGHGQGMMDGHGQGMMNGHGQGMMNGRPDSDTH